MRIGELSKQAGISVEAIRYYEKQGLIQSQRSSELGNNYREFSQHNLLKLNMVAQAKRLGFTLKEIKALFDKLENGDLPVEQRVAAIQQKTLEVEQSITQLQQLKATLEEVIERIVTAEDCDGCDGGGV